MHVSASPKRSQSKCLLCRSGRFPAYGAPTLPQLDFCREVTPSSFSPTPFFSEFDLCRQTTNGGFSGARPSFTADIPCPRQMLIYILMYWSLLLIHLSLVSTDFLLLQHSFFQFPLFKCLLLSPCLFETFWVLRITEAVWNNRHFCQVCQGWAL